MHNARFVGIDLAWGDRNPSGLAVLRMDEDWVEEVFPARLLYSDEEIVGAINEADSGETLVIAVDAPLIVPNLTGERPVERAVRQRFSRYHAGCHPANRRLLGDPPRGERLCRLLEVRLGVQVAVAPPVRERCRVVFEVYPHAAMVNLFSLPRILQYKARPGRSLAYRRQQIQELIRLLGCLTQPTLQLPDWLHLLPETGAELKRLEDRVDALFCAWLSARACLLGGEVVGDAMTGSIWLPRGL